jgi:phosphoglycerate dehydrogenase-like enzyme
MTVQAYDPYVDASIMSRYGVDKVALEKLLATSDFISIHSPLTAETRHLLGTREFGLMKEGVFLVNTSRGSVINEAALVEALRVGKLSGVGLDVMEQEPLSPDSPLCEFDNVTLTPHVAAYSEESADDLYRAACRIATDISRGIWPQEVVNPEVKSSARFRC